jgi:hypothetical protein
MKLEIENKNTATANAYEAADRDGEMTAAQATACAFYRCSTLLASVVVAFSLVLAASAQAGVNLIPSVPPGYSAPLTLYVENNKILGAWAVANSGNVTAAPHDVGFYVGGRRVFGTQITSSLAPRYGVWGKGAPFNDYLVNGENVVEVRVNDTRRVTEDTYNDNTYSVRVTVNRTGGGGGTPPTPLTRAEAGYKFPATLGNSSVSRIISRMNDMFVAQWVPSADFTNWLVRGTTWSYSKGTRYYGLPYSQANPQTDVTGFMGYLPAMKGTLNSTTAAGVDCSGSISIAWELPSRHATSTFDVSSSSYFTTVVSNGKLAANASKIQAGDAIVSKSWGHMVLVLSSPVNGKVALLESTVDQGTNANGTSQRRAVVKNTRSLSDLDAQNCRVIRRAKLQ